MTVKHDSMAYNDNKVHVEGNKDDNKVYEGDGEGKRVPPCIYIEPTLQSPVLFSKLPSIARSSIHWSSMLITPHGGWYYA